MRAFLKSTCRKNRDASASNRALRSISFFSRLLGNTKRAEVIESSLFFFFQTFRFASCRVTSSLTPRDSRFSAPTNPNNVHALRSFYDPYTFAHARIFCSKSTVEFQSARASTLAAQIYMSPSSRSPFFTYFSAP